MQPLPNAPAARRNAAAILAVLHLEFADRRLVLEIGSGTGQHAVFFTKEFPKLTWQPSDRHENLEGISAWVDSAQRSNLLAPVAYDVLTDAIPEKNYDAIFSANTAHIMSWSAVRAMFAACGRILPPGGLFCLYGPFNLGGTFTSESNQRFDHSLRRQDASMGIRNLENLIEIAEPARLELLRRYAMPANNQVLVWQKSREQPA